MKAKFNQNKAYLFALLAVAFWSTMSSAFKITLSYIKYDELLLWSSIVGVIALFIVNRFSKSKIALKKIKRKDLLSSAIMGLINPFLYYLVLFKAYELLEAQMAGTLNYSWPIILVIMSAIFLRQKISFLNIVAITISFIGIIIISTRGNLVFTGSTNITGVLLAIGSAFLWAYYWILNLKDTREETGKIFLNLLFGVVYILIYMIIKNNGILLPSGNAIFGIIYIGLFEMSLTFVIWLLALKNSENTAKVTNLIYLSPFIALFIIKFSVGEDILPSTIIGLVFIISGILFQQAIHNLRSN